MKNLKEIIDQCKAEILPGDAEDWQVMCEEVAKRYAIEVIDEISNNLSEYIEVNTNAGHDGIDTWTTWEKTDKWDELKQQLK